MRNRRLALAFSVLLLLALGLTAPLSAAQPSGFQIALYGGLGGASDAEPDTDFDNPTVQLSFSMPLDNDSKFVVRAGQIDQDTGNGVAFDSELVYLTLAGEYRFTHSFYESGLFLGLGGYDLSGGTLGEDESAFGVTAGVNGSFDLGGRWGLLVEFAGHYADFDNSASGNLFFTGLVGLGFTF